MSKPSFNKISQDRAPDTKKMKLPIEEVYYRKINQFKQRQEHRLWKNTRASGTTISWLCQF